MVELPYGPWMTQRLPSIHRLFLILNRWFAVPALRAGLGPLLSTPVAGSLMLLRTTGSRTGLRREVPLGYLIVDGAVYCCAGMGPRAAWYRNLCADPRVEVILPTVAISGVAATVTDRAEWEAIFPRLIRALGVVGRLTLGDVDAADAARRDALRRSLPLVRIRPTGLAAGPADPGGRLWVVVAAATVVLAGRFLRTLRRRTPSGSSTGGSPSGRRRA
jgi:deazaflavin-dependent oxidoreductase (nitroreductase family)